MVAGCVGLVVAAVAVVDFGFLVAACVVGCVDSATVVPGSVAAASEGEKY